MKRMILRQLWNQRRANGWILVELIFVTFFLWQAIDPVYVLLSNKAIPDNYDLSDTYLLQVGEYQSGHRLYRQESAGDSLRRADYMRVVDKLKKHPGITHVAVTAGSGYPQANSYNGSTISHDTIEAGVQNWVYLSGTDFMEVFRIRGLDGKVSPSASSGTDAYYVTENLAEKFFQGTPTSARGGLIRLYGDSIDRYPVTDVVASIQTRTTAQPPYLLIHAQKEIGIRGLPFELVICFRVRDGLASPAFTEKFYQEMRSQLRIGNFYLFALTDFETVSRKFEQSSGTTGVLQLQSILASFCLFCAFLGMAGTFWLRGNARRSEVGLRMALGSSRSQIHRQFLTEAWILNTIGFLIGLILVFQYVYYKGFANPNDTAIITQAYMQNRAIPHFLCVSGIVYLLMVMITFIGTWIPAARAANVHPSDALRDE